MSAPSFQDYFDAGKAEAIDRRPELTFDEGDVSELLIAGGAAMSDHLTGYYAGRLKATFLDGAAGDDLTVLADDHWNVQRFEAQFASGQVTFTRAAPGAAGTIFAGHVIATEKDENGLEIQYTVDADVNWLGADLAKVANVTAIIAGSTGEASVNTVVRNITTPFDSSITVNNPTDQMAGGEDAESDEDLRERVRALPATLRRGTIAALEFGALTVSGVRKATVEEETSLSIPTGIVNLYVTDSAGNSSTTMIAAVEAEIENWRCAGVIVNVFGGQVLTQNVTVIITARAGVDTAALVVSIQTAITERIKKLKIGESLSPDIIKQAVLNVDDDILSVNVTVPAVTVVPAANELIRAGTVTVS